MEDKEFELWIEGFMVTGNESEAQFITTVRGPDFNSAVKSYVETLDADTASYWNFRSGRWDSWGCRAFDNEADARKAFG